MIFNLNRLRVLSALFLWMALLSTTAMAQNPVPPGFVQQAGFYSEPLTVTLMAGSQDVIYYTLDGSIPDENSFVYDGGIEVGYRSDQEPVLLTIDRVSHGYQYHAPPSGPVQFGTVIRARSLRNGVWSRTITATYIVHPDGNNRFSLPVVSLATDSVNFFGHQDGIYVTGIDYENWQNVDINSRRNNTTGGVPANYFRRGIETEKPTHFELFEPDGRRVLAQDIGVRIHGGLSRAMRLKSLRLYSRSDYGVSRFRHQIFPDEPTDNFNRLLLRASGQDMNKTMYRDAMMQRLVRHLSFETQAYRPALLFLNGEFWGIHNFRERYDKHYLSIKYDIDDTKIDLLTGRNGAVQEGSNQTYTNVLSVVRDQTFSEAYRYAYAERRVDLQNFSEYILSNVYFNNRDWPHGNIDFWRYQAPGGFDPSAEAPYDGRWRWMMFDTDMGFGWTDTHRESTHEMHVFANTIRTITAVQNGQPLHRTSPLLIYMLRLPEFQRNFLNTHMDLMNTSFKTDRVLGIINDMASVIEPHMQEHMDRMGYHHDRWRIPQTMGEWDTAVDFMRKFAIDRTDTLQLHMLEHFNMPGYADVTIGVNDTLRGKVKLNTIYISESTPGIQNIGNPASWTGTYYKSNTISATAYPEDGWVFDYWVEYPDSSETIRITPDDNFNLTAVFNKTVSVEEIESDFPAEVALHQNFPNPFNPTTNIVFQIPEASEVKLTVFDLLGREIAVLAEGVHSLGRHQVTFDGSRAASGVYMYQLNYGGERLNKRFTLIK